MSVNHNHLWAIPYLVEHIIKYGDGVRTLPYDEYNMLADAERTFISWANYHDYFRWESPSVDDMDHSITALGKELAGYGP